MNNSDQHTVEGKCLCGKVSFKISGALPDIYQCHCSKCRKVSGSSSNSAMIVNHDQFAWLSGKSLIRYFMQDSGFKSDFCSNCGSPLPNMTANDTAYWIPAGLLEGEINSRISEHVYLNSKANWDPVS